MSTFRTVDPGTTTPVKGRLADFSWETYGAEASVRAVVAQKAPQRLAPRLG